MSKIKSIIIKDIGIGYSITVRSEKGYPQEKSTKKAAKILRKMAKLIEDDDNVPSADGSGNEAVADALLNALFGGKTPKPPSTK